MADKHSSPTDRVEALYRELVTHYGGGDDRELRAAAKLLLVALAKFRAHGGRRWAELLDEYVDIVKHDPGRLERMLQSNSGTSPDELQA
ncbi:MAG: hypothetical protein LJE69_19380 [Thiohalocapsa sp.]|jgi:hypothetical protein|uniref:hypothetical protein n=1 Tax=Thiohalocapsa sp. TaxID=2497641 RepID=UPI0025D389A5|nr:hypothetical protein [Thiohalocapsa sp.]MCG6943399.1 hypothetical protein [Thiohalocapsa sp.]